MDIKLQVEQSKTTNYKISINDYTVSDIVQSDYQFILKDHFNHIAEGFQK